MEKITFVYIGAREHQGKRYYGYIDVNDDTFSPLYFKNRLGNFTYHIGALIESEVDGKVYRNNKLSGQFLDKSHPLFSQLTYFSMEEKSANILLENIKSVNKKSLSTDFESHVKALCDNIKYLDRNKRRLIVQHIVSKLYETI